jgi:hypothetical protein
MIFSELAALLSNAQTEILIENAYFVPRDRGVELTAALHARGVKVRVLTNSLASNDVLAVHSGYQKYRDDLLENGGRSTLRPDSTVQQLRWSSVSEQSRAGLHAKAMVVDRRYVVVGSYNLDPRSADINTELALLVDSPAFAEKVAEFFDDGVKPENSYRVTLEEGRLRWTTSDDGTVRVYTQEPETSWWQRFKAMQWASRRSLMLSSHLGGVDAAGQAAQRRHLESHSAVLLQRSSPSSSSGSLRRGCCAGNRTAGDRVSDCVRGSAQRREFSPQRQVIPSSHRCPLPP